MRECLYEKNVNFDESYRKQKNIVTSQIVRAVNINLFNFLIFFFFKKKKLLIANFIIVQKKSFRFPANRGRLGGERNAR